MFLRFLLFLQTSAVSRIRHPEYWACFYFDIAAPLPCPDEWYCEATQPTALHGNTHCLLLMICQDGLPCTGAKRERLIENARIRDLA